MASVAYNSFKTLLFTAGLTAGMGAGGIAGVKIGLLKQLTTTPDNPDHDFMNDIATDEFNDTNYTAGFGGAGRKTLANRAISTDNVNNRSEWDFDDIVWTTLGGTQTAVMAPTMREITNDAATNLLTIHDIADTATNGTDFTLQVGSEGAVHIT